MLPPPDPVLMESEYPQLKLAPKSPPETVSCRFIAENMGCHHTRRCEWWRALAHVRFYVRELYAYTQYSGMSVPCTVPNSTSSGNPGQDVVRTALGTITWVPSDHRIICSSTNRQL